MVFKSFRRNEASVTVARLLIWTATLTWLSLALFYRLHCRLWWRAELQYHRCRLDYRILITTFVLWLVVAAIHVRSRSR
jgi:hypothetical protein